MKRIILDYFRRWWWVWLLGGIAHGFVTAGVCFPDDPAQKAFSRLRSTFPPFPVGFFFGSLLLSFDLLRGHTRALLTLPVTPKQIGRAWWWVSVGLPVLVLGAVTALVIGIMLIIAALAHTEPIAILKGVNYWLMSSLTFGTMFFALTGMLWKPGAVDWCERTGVILCSILWIGAIGVWIIIKDYNLHTQVGVIVVAVTSILSVLGWFRAETLVRGRAGFRIAFESSSGKNAKPSRCAEGHGGLPFLFQTIFNRMTIIGLWQFGFCILIFYVMLHGFLIPMAGHDATKEFLRRNVSTFTFTIWWGMSFQMFQYACHLRFLRTLPVSAAKLAGVLVFTPLFAMVVVLYAATLLLAALQSSPLAPEKFPRWDYSCKSRWPPP